MVQIILEKSASQIPGKRVLFAALFSHFFLWNHFFYFQSDYSKNEPLSFDLWSVRYKIGQIIAIPQIHSILHFLNL